MGNQILGTVKEKQGNPVSFFYPLFEEEIGQLLTGFIKLPVGDNPTIENNGRFVGMFFSTHTKVFMQRNLA
jgi:hypothetical protein